MLFKRQVFFIHLLLSLIICNITMHHVHAETIKAEVNFKKKEKIVIITNDTPTQTHDFIEYYISWLFEKTPYLSIVELGNSDKLLFSEQSSMYVQTGISNIETFKPNFDFLEKKNFSYLLYYTVEESAQSITLSYILFDGLYQNSILSNSHTVSRQQIKHLIRQISNDVFIQITGEFGFFIGKALYTERSKKTGLQMLFSQGVDSKKHQYTKENEFITSPSYCDAGKTVFFAEKQDYEMDIYELHFGTSIKKKINFGKKFHNVNTSSPEASHDCKNLLFVASDGDHSDIHLYSFINKNTIPIIADGNINTRPAFAQNNAHVYYISNKLRAPKIFSKIVTESTANLVSRGLGSYIYFSISPDESKIAFVKIFNGTFYLGTMNIDGGNEMLLRSGYIIEAPSWAPFGNNIIASIQEEETSSRKIHSISSMTGLSYPLRISSGDIVQANWLVDETDILQQYH